MSIFFVEVYVSEKENRGKYRALMKKIQKSLHEHSADIPELLSYRTFEAGTEGPLIRYVEMFEFPDQESRERFFGRFSGAKWLRGLSQEFFELVSDSKMQKLTWTEFLKDGWFSR